MQNTINNQEYTSEFCTALQRGADALSITLSTDQQAQLLDLALQLAEWNLRMNLTAVRTPAEVAVKHVLDSLTCLKADRFPPEAAVADIGTGAGFPGLPLKVVRPDLRLTFIDSTRKKLAFVEHMVVRFGWKDTSVVSGRAEELAHNGEYREQYDVVTARAVAAMNVLAEFCLPFIRVGGHFIAMKGPRIQQELDEAASAFARLGGRLQTSLELDLPMEGGARSLVTVEKYQKTPQDLPRLYRDIKRAPF